MKITSNVFEAYLKCPMKCWLRATDEPFSGSAYANWVKTQHDFYRATVAEQLHAQSPINKIASPFATGSNRARAQVQTVWGVLESEVSAVECISSAYEKGRGEFIPICSIFTNKVCKDDKLLLSFDAFVLSESLGREIRVGK